MRGRLRRHQHLDIARCHHAARRRGALKGGSARIDA